MDSNNFPSVEDMQAAFGIAPEAETDTEANQDSSESVEEPEVNETDTTESESSEGTEGAGDDAQQTTPEQTETISKADNKQNQAFARMRTENAQMHKTMVMMAQILGIDPKMPADQLSAQLEAQTRNALARKNNMDPQILERLDHLEQINAEYTRMQNQNKIQTSLRNIQEKFKATDDDLKAFINDLVSENFDATAENADLEHEFISRNFEKILKNRVDAAVKEEQERSAKAAGASKPDSKTGKDRRVENHEINSIAELESFFKENT